MWLEGKTDVQIAEALGTTQKAVYLHKHKYWTPEALKQKDGDTLGKNKTTSSGRKKKVPEMVVSPERAPVPCNNTNVADTKTTEQEETKVNNCIIIGEKRIELTEEQVAKIVAALGAEKVSLSTILEGNTFKLGSYEFLVLEQNGDTTAVILKDMLPAITFGKENNRYDNSNVDQVCCKFAEKVVAATGSDNVIPHTVDLTSNDGLKDYNQVERAVSVLTAEQYRRYVAILDKAKPDGWWWLATPWSTPSHESDGFVLCVSPSGGIGYGNYDGDYGVRPFLIFHSSIFGSSEAGTSCFATVPLCSAKGENMESRNYYPLGI